MLTATDAHPRQSSSEAAVRGAIDSYIDTLEGLHKLYVGFSGGLDSTVLLHALAARAVPGLRALHVDHSLQDDSVQWQAHCKRICSDWGIPLRSAQLLVEAQGRGIEAAARDARYDWFESCLEPGDTLLLAHHLDDQVETLMLRLLRGAGPEGLAAMASERAIGCAELHRPLLLLPRSALLDYARSQKLEWIEDPSNCDIRYDRNYLRAEIMPRLETRWPGYRKTLSRAAQQVRELAQAVPESSLKSVYSVVGDPGFLLAELPDDAPGAARAVRAWLRQRALAMPAAARLAEFLRQLRDGENARMATQVWVLERYRDAVYIYRPMPAIGNEDLSIAVGAEVSIEGCGIVSVSVSVSADADLDTEQRLLVRMRRGGERLLRPGGHHSGLKSVFQDAAIPPWWRARVPLLYRAGVGGEDLLAVGTLARAPEAVRGGITLHWQPYLLEVN
ncbi:MAG: tRNA lysidine(34) synthetase TilS [Congregibacter sp.]